MSESPDINDKDAIDNLIDRIMDDPNIPPSDPNEEITFEDPAKKYVPDSEPEPKQKKSKKKFDSDEKDDRPIFYANKFNGYKIKDSDTNKKTLFESINIGRESRYLFQNDNETYGLYDQVDDLDRIIQPSSRNSRQAKARSFDFIDLAELDRMWYEIDNMTIDDLFETIKTIFDKYIAADNYIRIFLSATAVFSYFVDLFDIVYYPYIIGDHGSGKTAILDVFDETAYRTMMSSSQSDAAVYNGLGFIEEVQQTLLMDEAHIAKSGMLEILKSGYDRKGKAHRVQDTSKGRIVIEQSTFCLKIMIGDKPFEGEAAKPVNDRCFIIKSSPTQIKRPRLYIKDVIRTKNAERYRHEREEMSNFRKFMLLYRIKHYKDNFPEIKLSVYNRDRELTQSLLEVFHDSDHQEEIRASLDILLESKRQKKSETKDAILCNIINQFSDTNNLPMPMKNELEITPKVIEKVAARMDKEDVFGVTNEWIWGIFMEETGSEWKFQDKDGNPKKTIMISADYGEISVSELTKVMYGKFGGEHVKFTKYTRGAVFNKQMIANLVENYNSKQELRIEKMETAGDAETPETP